MDDKVENAVEKSDQYHEMLMKPVTVANHKQMEKTVSEAIAHAKRVGDDDLLELAEEIGNEILALRSRASRPGEKAKMSLPNISELQKIVNKLIERGAYYASLEYKPAEKKRVVKGHQQDTRLLNDLLAAVQANNGAKAKATLAKIDPVLRAVLPKDTKAWASQHSRPGAKAEMARMSVSAVERVCSSVEGDLKSIRIAAKRQMSDAVEQYAAQAISTLSNLESVEFARPGEKAAFVRLPDDYARNFEYLKRAMSDITRAFKVADHIALKEAADDLLLFAKQISQEARSDAADMKKHPKDWSARPGEKAEFAPITGRTGMNDREKMRVMDQAIRASGMTEMELKKNHPEIYQSVDRIRRNPGFYSVKDAAHIANKIKELKATASRPGAKAQMGLEGACWEGYEAVGTKQKDGKTVPNCVPKETAAKPDDTEREDVKAGLKIMSAADPKVSDKIRTLIKEGKPQDQAVAIALDMKRRGEL